VGRLAGVEVLLGISGGVAAYKAASLARALRREGAGVQALMTESATRFVQPAQLAALTGRPCLTDTWTDPHRIVHVEAARRADVAIFAPATANLLAKMAAGISDDVVTSTYTCCTAPVVVAPAMHTEMWQHAATQAAVATLLARGVAVVGPAEGDLAGGDVGVGRLADEPDLVDAVVAASGRGDRPLAGRRVLVTAGATREHLDPVRFLSNRSTGKMGYAIAHAARDLGAEVDLVSGPTALVAPAGVTVHPVSSGLDMHAAVMRLAPDADVIVKAAAVGDFRPETVAEHKLKKDRLAAEGDADGVITVRLVQNPDILADLGASGDLRAVLVGFAAETTDVEAHGRAKLERKGADLVVINDVSRSDAGFATDTNVAVILGRDGFREDVPLTTKRALAERICRLAADRIRA
jgi:phosphopantothenoylcysteine decarboxylase / phosphopantothenate---cysteine ligase